MARISRLGRRDVSEAVGEIYDRYVRQRGNVPNMFRTVAHRPEILQTMIAHMEAVLNTGTLPTALKELVIVRTSQMNKCEYCLASHSLLAKKLGYNDAQIAALPHFENSESFTPREKTALRLAERLTRNERALDEAELAELGAPAGRILKGEELRTRLASPRYLAALEDSVAAHIHPLNYTLGLAAAAQAAGAKLYTQTRVLKVEPGKTVSIQTSRGTVRAAFLLTAGGAYLGNLMRPLAGYIMPVGTYIMATEPRADVKDLIPGNEAVCDLNFVLNYYRRSADDRMLFGGRVSYSTLPPPSLEQSMLARAVRVFPQLANARVEYLWGGNVDISQNRAPHFGRLSENILFAQGFSGHGVALTGLTGKILAEAVAGQAERFDVFASIPHARFPGGRTFRVPALLLATTYFRLRDLL